MGNPARFVFHLFAVVLLFFSTGGVMGGNEYSLSYQEPAQAPLQSSLAISKANKVYCLSNSEEHVTNPVSNRRIPTSKNHPNTLFPGSYCQELQLAHVATQYLLHSRNIYPGLTGSAIIFPFHYFW